MRLGTAAAAVFAATILACLCGGRQACGAARVDEALGQSVNVTWAGMKLTDCLADLAKQAGVGFVLDPALDAGVRDTKVTYSGEAPLAVALGAALARAGLRYAVRGGTITISTPKRLARLIVYGRAETPPEAAPMDRGEAMSILSPLDGDYPLSDVRQIRNKPWRQVEEASVNPATGLPDFPGPPIWIDSPDADHPRFRYTDRPSFLKPEHLDKLDDKAALEREILGRIIEMLSRRTAIVTPEALVGAAEE